ncbi:MAG: hypothetical protein VX293_08665 [Candidatus Latescibacterota bacterium]|nr:hypothetical protein [Candidatus Latescibacterota bacterium]
MKILLVVIAMGVWGCTPFGGAPQQSAELTAAAQDLVRIAQEAGAPIDWLGLRDGKGNQTEATRVLDDYLVSALIQAEVGLALADTMGGKWRDGTVVALDQGGAADLVLGGRLQEDALWMYVRLFLVERQSGELVAARTVRVPQREVEDEVALRARISGGVDATVAVQVELHLLAKRQEGGIDRVVALAEGAQLQQGDKLQLRFKLNRDVEVYAFLYDSEGALEAVFPEQFVYSGIAQYGPSENGWITFNEIDRVYTLYFLAGSRLLEENAGEFYERVAELIQQRQVDRFTGLEKLDQTLVEFLQRSYQDAPTLSVQRGGEEIPLGRLETIVFDDGTRLPSQAEILEGAPVVVRALSFSVQ